MPLNRTGALALFSAVMMVSGCAGSSASRPDTPAAPGVDVRRDAVDGMTVGHRLMASGEYELALKAYYRAAGNQGLNSDVLTALGSANLKLGRVGQAEDLLRQAVKLDDDYPPAWNNLGVALMESGEVADSARVFRTAYALDGGNTDQIRDNLTLALAKVENPSYDAENNNTFALVRYGGGDYRLLATP